MFMPKSLLTNLPLIVLCTIIFISIPTSEKNKQSIKKLLLIEYQNHPKMKINDIYKFLHQSAFGSEHAIKDTAEARKWLKEEISSLAPYQNAKMLDTLSPDGYLVRVNLRPYLKKGNDPEKLLKAFINTANNYKKSVNKFSLYWKSAVELASSQKLPFSVKEMNKFFEEQSKSGFPAIHHSKEYNELYKPAYRVVDLRYLPGLKK
jgi:hypothetical protein